MVLVFYNELPPGNKFVTFYSRKRNNSITVDTTQENAMVLYALIPSEEGEGGREGGGKEGGRKGGGESGEGGREGEGEREEGRERERKREGGREEGRK